MFILLMPFLYHHKYKLKFVYKKKKKKKSEARETLLKPKCDNEKVLLLIQIIF